MALIVFSLIILSWLVTHTLLMPKPIKGIPHNFFARYMPWGDMVPLGTYFFTTGEVFSWLSLQNLHHKSALVQLFLPSFSTTHPTLVVAGLDEIHDIVTKRVGEIDRADLMHTWFGVVVPTATIGLKTSDKRFKEQRRLWNVVLSPRFLAEVAAECFFEAATDLADLWTRKSELTGESQAFAAREDIKMATLDGMWKMCVGTDLGLSAANFWRLQEHEPVKRESVNIIEFAKADLPEFYKVLGTLLNCLDWVMQGVSSRVYTWIFTYSGVLGRAREKKHKILGDYIAASRDRVEIKTTARTCALDEVLRKHTRLSGELYAKSEATSDSALQDELLELLITGHETTASSIAWALKYLTDNPETQRRLRDSLVSSLLSANSSAELSAKDITTASIPYLDATVAETLRLSNTGPVSFRQTLVPCEVLGHQVPAGTPLILVTAGPSYESVDATPMPQTIRGKIAAEALLQESHLPPTSICSIPSPQTLDMFVPDRWLANGKFDSEAVRMLPFSAGPRGCFGENIAMIEMRIMIAVLVLKFEFPQLAKSLSGYQAQDGLTSRPTYCYVNPRPTKEVISSENDN
jgi:cytochrome P450